jgi:hypothetical protein
MADISIYDAEAKAAVIADKELAEPFQAAAAVLNLCTNLHSNHLPEKKLPRTKAVRLLLLQRIQNDLRCCVILVELGYAMQGASLAAGIFEAWVTLANIITHEDAVKWLSHDSESKSFGKIRTLTDGALRNFSGDTRDLDKFYGQYQQLCMPKHLNPIVEKGRGYEFDGKSVRFRPGPDTSELAIRLGWFALERASRFAFMGLVTFADSERIPEHGIPDLDVCRAAVNALQDECARRFGGYDSRRNDHSGDHPAKKR